MAPTAKFSFAALAAVAMLLATAAPPALAQTAPVPAGGAAVTPEACRARLQSEGGESALVSRTPSCSALATSAAAPTAAAPAGAAAPAASLTKCCDEIKAGFADPFFAQCACLPAVWTEARNRIVGAGLQGVSPETVDAFIQSCGVKVAGSGC
jgi:hypothetical protein